jgi:hypothetical protein
MANKEIKQANPIWRIKWRVQSSILLSSRECTSANVLFALTVPASSLPNAGKLHPKGEARVPNTPFTHVSSYRSATSFHCACVPVRMAMAALHPPPAGWTEIPSFPEKGSINPIR